MSGPTRDGTAELVSRDHILRRERVKGNFHFSCSADHEQDWQPYDVDPHSAESTDHTYILPEKLFRKYQCIYRLYVVPHRKE